MVYLQLGSIQSGGWSDNVGIFSGQNIQNAWDAHSASTNSVGGQFGDLNLTTCFYSLLSMKTVYSQPTYDNDFKGNNSPMSMGT